MQNKQLNNLVMENLNDISNTASTNEKLEKLEIIKNLNNELSEYFKKVLKYAYSSNHVFGLKPILFNESKFEIEDVEKAKDYDDIFVFLNDLQNRVITGDSAKLSYLKIYNKSDDDTKELLNRILEKNVKAGFSVKSINKVFNKLIEAQMYMRCSLLKEITNIDEWVNPTKGYIFVQEKMDGMFVNVNNGENALSLVTRQGSEFNIDSIKVFEELKNNLSMLEKNHQYHGELLLENLQDGSIVPRQESNGSFNSALKKGDDNIIDADKYRIIIKLWDKIPYSIFLDENIKNDEINQDYEKRLISLENDTKKINNNSVEMVVTDKVSNIYESIPILKQMLNDKKEGTVCKLPTMKWSNSTSRGQIKFKNKFVIELKIIGLTKGTNKNKDLFGAVECVSSDDKLYVAVSSSGFTDEEKLDMFNNFDSYVNKIISVESNSVIYSKDESKKSSLFLPVFVELRLDKNDADSLERIESQYEESLLLIEEKIKAKIAEIEESKQKKKKLKMK